MPLPPWVADRPHKDNWQTVARVRAQAEERPADEAAVRTAAPPRDSSVMAGGLTTITSFEVDLAELLLFNAARINS